LNEVADLEHLSDHAIESLFFLSNACALSEFKIFFSQFLFIEPDLSEEKEINESTNLILLSSERFEYTC